MVKSALLFIPFLHVVFLRLPDEFLVYVIFAVIVMMIISHYIKCSNARGVVKNSAPEQINLSDDDYDDAPSTDTAKNSPKGKFCLKYDNYTDYYGNDGYYEKIDSLNEARIAAKALFYNQVIRYIHIYEGNKKVETLKSPFPEGIIYASPEYELIAAKCLLPESLFRWANLAKRHGEIECWDNGRMIETFEVEEKDLKPEKRRQYVDSYLEPVMTYESQVVKNYYCRLNLKRRVWVDKDGNKVKANHELPINGLVKVYSPDEHPEEKDMTKPVSISFDQTVISTDSADLKRSSFWSFGNSRKRVSGFTTSDVYADENYTFTGKNLSDMIERESWLDELDRSEKDDPWD